MKGDITYIMVFVLVGERKMQRDIRPYVKLLCDIVQYAQVVCRFYYTYFAE